MKRLRTCPTTPGKLKFFCSTDAWQHIHRTNAMGLQTPREPYWCHRCGWVHVRTIREEAS